MNETAFRPSDRWLTPPQAAEMLGISLQTLHRKTREGLIPWGRPPGTRLIRYREKALLSLMEKQERRTPPVVAMADRRPRRGEP